MTTCWLFVELECCADVNDATWAFADVAELTLALEFVMLFPHRVTKCCRQNASWHRYEANPSNGYERCHNLARDCDGIDVAIANRCHGYDGPPKRTGYAAKFIGWSSPSIQ